MYFQDNIFRKNINTEQKTAIASVGTRVYRKVFLLCRNNKKSCMEPKNLTPVGNSPELRANLLTAKIVSDKNNTARNKHAEKKCVYRTETGFCNRSNKQCPTFIL
jgi:hypothetical protein